MSTSRDLFEASEKSAPLWSGADVAKEWFDAAVWPANHPIDVRRMRELPTKRFERTFEGARAYLEWAEKKLGATPRVVMEATGSYSTELAIWLIAQRPACQPAIINPRTAKDYIDSLDPRNNTDQIAARALARYGMERCPAPYEPPTPERAALRELTRFRVIVIEQRVAHEARLGEVSHHSAVTKMIRADIKRLEKQEKKLDEEIRAHIRKNPALNEDIQLLRSIYGVDWTVAATVLAELGNLRRFEHARQLTAFAGVAAGRKESGKSVHGRAKVCKMGSPAVRRVLCMAARSAVRGANDWADDYSRLVEAGKTKRAAESAIARKILVTMRAILITRKPYEKHYGAACG
jgi:transposase